MIRERGWVESNEMVPEVRKKYVIMEFYANEVSGLCEVSSLCEGENY